MSVFDVVRIIVYRFHEKGLEVFLVNSDLENDPEIWKVPKERFEGFEEGEGYPNLILLDPIKDAEGNEIQAYAIEGDWHDIPSIRGMIRHDVRVVKETIKEIVPGIEKGAFFAVKEALKKVMPNEYATIKELKDILLDRNLLKYM